jgi:hypothetical protein
MRSDFAIIAFRWLNVGLGDLAVHRVSGEEGCGTGRQVRVREGGLGPADLQERSTCEAV